jgi:signal transduction histidine kinase
LHGHAYALSPLIGLALMAIICGGAIWKGGMEERATAIALLLAWAGTLMLRDPRWIGPQWGAFMTDGLLLVFLLAQALWSPKYWPIFAAGFHLLAVITHTARIIDVGLGAWAYATAALIWAYLVLGSLAVGTWNVWRRRQRLDLGARPAS